MANRRTTAIVCLLLSGCGLNHEQIVEWQWRQAQGLSQDRAAGLANAPQPTASPPRANGIPSVAERYSITWESFTEGSLDGPHTNWNCAHYEPKVDHFDWDGKRWPVLRKVQCFRTSP
jgi:hypothetical protein